MEIIIKSRVSLMRKLLIFLSFLGIIYGDNVDVAYTDYSFGDPNKCTVTQADADKVIIFFL